MEGPMYYINPATGLAEPVQGASGAAHVTDAPLDSIIDTNADGYTYFYKAAAGSLTSAAVWQIKRTQTGTNPAVFRYPTVAGTTFTAIADNRTSLAYPS